METSTLKEFLTNFDNSITDEAKALYKKVIENSDIKTFKDYDEFFFAVIYPFREFIRGFVRSEISDNVDVVFLMLNSQFVTRHFEALIERKEGWPCSADKSTTIMRALMNHFRTGEKIEFNYDGEYTYHLPKKIFASHDQIVNFYEGLKDLYYGRSEKYLKSLKDVLTD